MPDERGEVAPEHEAEGEAADHGYSEWISEVRRLYVEPKGPAELQVHLVGDAESGEQARDRGRRHLRGPGRPKEQKAPPEPVLLRPSLAELIAPDDGPVPPTAATGEDPTEAVPLTRAQVRAAARREVAARRSRRRLALVGAIVLLAVVATLWWLMRPTQPVSADSTTAQHAADALVVGHSTVPAGLAGLRVTSLTAVAAPVAPASGHLAQREEPDAPAAEEQQQGVDVGPLPARAEVQARPRARSGPRPCPRSTAPPRSAHRRPPGDPVAPRRAPARRCSRGRRRGSPSRCRDRRGPPRA